MIARLPIRKAARLLWAAPGLCFVLLVVSGCDLDGGYPQELTYPLRSDALVVGRADKDAPEFDRPGEYPAVLFPYLSDEERNKMLLDPQKLKPELRQQLATALGQIFGTPAEPRVEGNSDQIRDNVKQLDERLRLDTVTLARGSVLYRQQCLHCHGLTGDGRGPTAPWVNPHPRDYRQGVFKFTSSSQQEGQRKPRREDLERTVREGINGSSMPSFRLLADDDIEALVSYVIHLSLRGETEFNVTRALINEEETDVDNGVNEYVTAISRNWLQAQDSMIKPGSPPAFRSEEEQKQSIQRGYQLFIQQGGAGCIGCHTDYGRQAAYKYDYWGTVVRPADVTTGVYRGGRRPIDLFWRIHSGINGTGMTAFGQSLQSDQIWDLVNFVQVLPYPSMRQKYGIKLENN